MTDKIDAQISAFIDDELITEESELLVRRLCSDPAMRQTAARYTMIGDALRGSLDAVRLDLNNAVMDAIDENAESSAAPDSADQPAARPWGRLLGGGAIAAAVAVVAITALQPDPAKPGLSTADTLSVTAGAISGEVVPSNDTSQPLGLTPTPGLRRAGNAAALDDYVLLHNQYAQRPVHRPVRFRALVVPAEVEGESATSRRTSKP
ncbi:MAG: sigma-E factor negative regulatory protein [Pseudomonadota bacterium]